MTSLDRTCPPCANVGPMSAGRLRVPASTLESKIKTLKIDKRRFKPG